MDANVFATQIAKGTTLTGNGGATALAGKGGMFSGSAGLNFMDLILAQLQAQGDGQTALPAGITNAIDAKGSAEIAGKASDLEKLAGQALAALKQAGAETAAASDGNLGLVILSPQGRQKLLDTLQSFLNGQPDSGGLTIQSLNKGILKNLNSNDLKTAKTEDGDPALIVSGLTPQQLTDLLKKIQEGGDAAEAGLTVGIVQLTPPDQKKEGFFKTGGSALLPAQNNSALAAAAAQAAAGSPSGTSTSSPETEASAMTALSASSDTESKGKAKGFDEILKMFESAKGDSTGKPMTNAELKALMKDAPGPANTTLPAALQTAQGDIVQDSSWTRMYPETLGLTNGVTGVSAHSAVTTVAQMTSLSGSAPQAIYPHPATQQVASALTRFTNGTESALTLRLDPPELGRISVRMLFNKDDKTIKAVLTAEKPETYMMLQRDSQVLQRSLQDAGLDTSNGGLSFQLSQDGSLAGQGWQQHNQGGNAYQGSGDNAPADETVIETTMNNWSVDPQTGTMHYTIWA